MLDSGFLLQQEPLMKKRLLLHICCAPDATIGIERLADQYEVEGYFYNPNIHPLEEHHRRGEAMENLSCAVSFPYREGRYDPERWLKTTAGMEDEPEKGRRCVECIRLRLQETSRAAKEGGFDLFAAVLTVSPHKELEMINRLGEEAGRLHGVEYLPTDLKEKDGFRRSVELSKKYKLYRQNYCGCVYSMRDKD
jgi:predicted adenine nucleotide alpha hydrolase (AANH) superfamily ATPase